MSENKKKGDLLEKIVENLCTDLKGSKVTRKAKIKGKTGIIREVDVLIEAEHKSFDVMIAIEAKNYSRKVDIVIIEAFKTKLNDIGANLGVVVCPLGFTSGAVKCAKENNIQLFQVFDHELKNTNQFIPLRYIVPSIETYNLQIAHKDSSGGSFSLPIDTSKWKFYIKDKVFNKRQLIAYAWNNGMVPQNVGKYIVDFGAVKIGSSEDEQTYYMELKSNVIIKEDCYLKLFPASFMKNISSGKGTHQLWIDAYSKKADMIKNGWKHFNTQEEMELLASVHDTSPDAKKLSIREGYTIEEPSL